MTPTRRAYLKIIKSHRAVVAAEWKNDFGAFLRDMGECPPMHVVERLDAAEPFSRDNCIYVEARIAKKTKHFVEHDGKRLPLIDYARRLEVDYDRLYNYVALRGLPIAAALRKVRAGKIKRSPIMVLHEGVEISLMRFAELMDVSYDRLRYRVRTHRVDPHKAAAELYKLGYRYRRKRER